MAGKYFNFQLHVSGQVYGEYQAQVVSSPVGESQPTAVATPDPMQITALRSDLAAKPTEEAEIALGRILFEDLFTGPVRDALFRSLDLAREGKGGLRLSLVIEPNELSALPWELLYNPRDERFMGRDGRNTIFRLLPTAMLPQPPTLELPLNILALFANPAAFGLPALDVVHERAVMEQALAPLLSLGMVNLITLEHATIDAMVDKLYSQRVNILYYQGHIGFDARLRSSYLFMEGFRGEPMVKGIEPLTHTLRSTNVSLAIINSEGMAAGSIAYELCQRGFPTCVATQEPLNDDETLTFLRQFTLALAEGHAVDSALTQTRQSMRQVSGPTARWASPILVTELAEPWLLTPEAQL